MRLWPRLRPRIGGYPLGFSGARACGRVCPAHPGTLQNVGQRSEIADRCSRPSLGCSGMLRNLSSPALIFQKNFKKYFLFLHTFCTHWHQYHHVYVFILSGCWCEQAAGTGAGRGTGSIKLPARAAETGHSMAGSQWIGSCNGRGHFPAAILRDIAGWCIGRGHGHRHRHRRGSATSK